MLHWLEEAADRDHPDANFWLGLALLKGQGFEKNKSLGIELAAEGGEHRRLLHVRCNAEELIRGAAYFFVLSENPASGSEGAFGRALFQAAGLHFSVGAPRHEDAGEKALNGMVDVCVKDFEAMVLEGDADAHGRLLERITYSRAWALKLLGHGDLKIERLLGRAGNDRMKAASILLKHLGPPNSSEIERAGPPSDYPPNLMRLALSIWKSRRSSMTRDEIQDRLRQQGEELLEGSVLLGIALSEADPQKIDFMIRLFEVVGDLHLKLLDFEYTPVMIEAYKRERENHLQQIVLSGSEAEQRKLAETVPGFLAWGKKLMQGSVDGLTGLHEHAWGDREKMAPLLLDYTSPPTEWVWRQTAEETGFQHSAVLSILHSWAEKARAGA